MITHLPFFRWVLFLAALCLILSCAFSMTGRENTPVRPDAPAEVTAAPVFILPEEGYSIDENGLEIRLYENQAIPYRWEWALSGHALKLVSDETVSGAAAPFAAGDSPAVRVFTFAWAADGESVVTLTNRRIEEYRSTEDPDDNAGARVYRAVRENGEVSVYEEEAPS